MYRSLCVSSSRFFSFFIFRITACELLFIYYFIRPALLFYLFLVSLVFRFYHYAVSFATFGRTSLNTIQFLRARETPVCCVVFIAVHIVIFLLLRPLSPLFVVSRERDALFSHNIFRSFGSPEYDVDVYIHVNIKYSFYFQTNSEKNTTEKWRREEKTFPQGLLCVVSF